MNSTTSMECDVNLEVDKELQSYIDAVPYEESRKALQKMAVIFKEKSIEDDARYAHLQNLVNKVVLSQNKVVLSQKSRPVLKPC